MVGNKKGKSKQNKYAAFSNAAANFAKVQAGVYRPPIVAQVPAPVKTPRIPYGAIMPDPNAFRNCLPNRLLQAHADLLAGLLTGLSSSNDMDGDFAKIEKSYGLLTQDRHRGLVSVLGFETLADVQDAIEKARCAVQEATEMSARQDEIDCLNGELFRISTARRTEVAVACRDRIVSLLNKLGPHAVEVYPQGVTTYTEMLAHVAHVYEGAYNNALACEAKEEREQQVRTVVRDITRLEQYGSFLRFSPEITDGPDEIRAKIHADISRLGVNLLVLNEGRVSNIKTEEQWGCAIENAYADSLQGAAYEWLDRRYCGSIDVRPYNNYVDFVEGGRTSICNHLLENRYLYVARGAADEHRPSSCTEGKFTSDELKIYQQIQAESRRNEAVLFVIATNFFAERQQRHDFMLLRTLEAVEKVGGLDVLDKIATARYGLAPELWNKMKAFVADADANRQQDANYRADLKRPAGIVSFEGPTS